MAKLTRTLPRRIMDTTAMRASGLERPVERRGFLPYRIPHETRHDGHHQRLIEGVPAEDLPAVQAQVLRRHQVLVIQPAGRAQNDGEDQAHKPFVAHADAFLLSREAQHHISRDSQGHADPLQQVQPLPEQEDGAQKHQHRACGVDRTHDGERQMFHREIPRQPGGQHEGALQEDVLLHFPASEAGGKQERREDEGRQDRVQEENRNDGIALQRDFLRRIIAAQERCGHECKEPPHKSGAKIRVFSGRRNRARPIPSGFPSYGR